MVEGFWRPGVKGGLTKMCHASDMNSWSVRDLLKSLAILGLAAIGLLAVLPNAPESAAVAVVFPPWWDASRTLLAAAQAGPVLRLGAARFVVLVGPLAPPARERVRRAGAWLLLSPLGLAGCRSARDEK